MAPTLKRILFWLLALAFIAPILVNSKFFFPFIVTKTFYFRLVVEAAVLVYVFLAWIEPRYRPRFSFLHWAVAAFLGAATLASLFGVHLERSFWGNAERGEGLLTLYHVGAFFYLLSFTVKSREDWLKLFTASVIVAVLTGIYGLAQLLQLKRLLIFNIIGSGRIASTIGNASFFAGYLLLNLFLAGILFFEKRSRFWKLFAGAAFLFLLIIIYETETRGAVLGFAGGLALFGVLLALTSKETRVRRLGVGAIGLVVILAAFIWLGRNSSFVQNQGTLRRLVSISAEDITTQSRLATWKTSLDAWRARPILGWGYENYKIAFNERFPVVIYRDEGSQVWFDRAHNAFLDVLVTSGIIGFLAYLAIFVAAGKLLWALYTRGERLLAVLLTTGLAAYIFQNLFVFDTLGTYILFTGLLAFLVASRREAQESQEPVPVVKPLPVFALVVLILLFLPAVYFFNVRPAQANRAISRGISLQRFERYEESAAAFREAIAIGTYMRIEARQKLADLAAGVINRQDVPPPVVREITDSALEEMEKNMKEEPDDVQHVIVLAGLYNNFASGDEARFRRSLELAGKALQMSPTRPQIYYEIGQAWAGRKDYPKAIAAFQKAIQMAPWVMEAHWNLGAAYVFAGDLEAAHRAFEEAAKRGLDLDSLRHLRRVAKVYLGAKQLPRAAETYERIIAQEPTSQNYATLAAIFKELGNTERACLLASEAAGLDPRFGQEAFVFMKQLGCKT